MELTIILDYIIISIIASIAINSLLVNFAQKYNLLVDLPNRNRKFHKRATPLTGGISILLALLIGALSGVYPAIKASKIQPAEAVRK